MIKGIGLDIIERERIDQSLQKDERLVRRVLTEKEQKLFHQLTAQSRKVEFLAGRFAVKEAFAKAVGTGIGKLSFQHINVLPDTSGAPTVQAKGYETMRIFVSITHSEKYVIAQIVLEDA